MRLSDYDLKDINLIEEEADKILKELFPITRSITGDGVRETYKILNKIAGFNVHEIPSGTECYDWVIPDEWAIRDAYIRDKNGNKIADFKENNLHVLNYSTAVDKTVGYDELVDHLHTMPQLPGAIPYRTSYYKRNWGFCMAHEQFRKLDKNAEYHVFIDAEHKNNGSLTLGDYLHQGTSEDEYLISSYSCHPSLANDNLSGMVLWAFLLKILQNTETRNNYRFCIWPETIGAIAYLSQHEKEMQKNKGGFVITTVAGPGNFGYKKSFLGNGKIDRIVSRTFKEFDIKPLLYDFDIMGSDERQLTYPAFRIPVGTITKSKYYEYPYYHTSLDNLDFISAGNLAETLKLYVSCLQKLENDVPLRSNFPFSEPNLGKRGLYPTTGGAIKQAGKKDTKELDIIKWVLFYADGQNSISDISEKTGFDYQEVCRITGLLQKEGLLKND